MSEVVWDPDGGGLHSRGERYSHLVARAEQLQKRLGGDRARRPMVGREKVETPEYEEGKRYTRKQLGFMADEILRKALKDLPREEYPAILLPEHLRMRLKREIYVSSGIPDPSIVAGLYWRTHPQGRSYISEEDRRKNKSSFYR